VSLAGKLSPQDLCRVLELTETMTRVRPDHHMALIPPQDRDEFLKAEWRRAFAKPGVQAILRELHEILNRDEKR
jgi:hypothetical protein